MKLQNKVALVTGSSSGIGKGIKNFKKATHEPPDEITPPEAGKKIDEEKT